MTMIYGFRRAGLWDGGREEKLLDDKEAFYRVYRASNDRFISLAPIELTVYDELRDRWGLPPIFRQHMIARYSRGFSR